MMKKVQKLNLVLFPYLVFGAGILVLYNGYPWMFFLIALIAFFGWAITAHDLERMRILEYLEANREMHQAEGMQQVNFKMGSEVIEKILEESKNLK